MSDLPFKVGELIESRYFSNGFRGAWFRCKILKIKYGGMSYLLEYPDYPDQKSTQIKVYQKPTHINKSKGLNKVLMVRPRFPTIYRESEKLDVNAISEVVVIVDDTWKIGDLVDWFSDGCYWCGKVTELIGNDKVQIDLLPPPHGEGCSYEALSKDLRPSLEWCPQNGWTVPMPTEDGRRCPARIMNPANSAGSIVNITAATDGAVNVDQPSSRSMDTRENMDIEVADNKNGRTSFSDIISSSHNSDSSIEILETAPINRHDDEYPAKMRTASNSLCLNSSSSNTTDSAILDLEELLNRVKWLRSVLKCEVPLSGAKRPSWQFSQHHASCN
ncbi:uncharacterized protein LOC131641505 isoform X1 [Vicia villosa]|uniref:uncharacterized protein LOC131641505 isoform X1 n=1 Tax=Vicia villosa TaxID=3911 RepID=UPI00273C7D95|nr:uncharacterized protein LOC131641505 isoform X1 [Vicia villosa]XP_058767790.1 uncharacterized protein LOC131641505 isoform X1 [Vicia villosa]